MTLANLLHCVTSLHYTCEPVMLGHRLLELCRLFVDVEPTRYASPLCVYRLGTVSYELRKCQYEAGLGTSMTLFLFLIKLCTLYTGNAVVNGTCGLISWYLGGNRHRFSSRTHLYQYMYFPLCTGLQLRSSSLVFACLAVPVVWQVHRFS